MKTSRISADTVREVLDAIDTAKDLLFKDPDQFDAWMKLVRAHSIVKVYLLDQFEPLDVEITP